MGIVESKYCRPPVEQINSAQLPSTGQQTDHTTPCAILQEIENSNHSTTHFDDTTDVSEHFASALAPIYARPSALPEKSLQNCVATALAYAPTLANISGLIQRLRGEHQDAVELPIQAVEVVESPRRRLPLTLTRLIPSSILPRLPSQVGQQFVIDDPSRGVTEYNSASIIPLAGHNPLGDFKGKIVVVKCRYGPCQRYQIFEDDILRNHPNETILCIDSSTHRMDQLNTYCRKRGHFSEILVNGVASRAAGNRASRNVRQMLFTTFANIEGLHLDHIKTVVIFGSPCRSVFYDEFGEARPDVHKTRQDMFYDAIGAVARQGKQAKVYIFVGGGTGQDIKTDVAEVLRNAGSTVPDWFKW